MIDEEKIKKLLERNILEIIGKEELIERIKKGEKLRIKIGADPTSPDLHLGHAVVLRKLREFQDLGHKIIFIIGDFTALIGDPSGREKTRPQLSKKEIEKNAKTYFEQVGKILDIKKTEIYYNSKWFSKLKFEDVLRIASKFTVARILERDDFSQRFKKGIEICLHEFLYLTMQAYDSAMVKADVEIGGSDQKFNMLAGRDLQRKTGLKEQIIMIIPLLIGLDGKEKMSKSLNNYIALKDPAEEMYGKVMSLPDDLIIHYFKLCTDLELEKIEKIEEKLKKGANPKDFKMLLARKIISLYNGKRIALKAEEEFVKIFREKEVPSKIKETKLKFKIYKPIDLLVELNLVKSKGEARRLIEQGGLRINKEKIKDFKKEIKIKKSSILQLGKRRFLKLF